MSLRSALIVEIVAGALLSLAGCLWLFFALLYAFLSGRLAEIVICLWLSAPGVAMSLLGVTSLASLGRRIRGRQVPEN